MVIFGASGDLTHRKLIPALFDLFQTGLLGQHFAVLGFSRSNLTNEEFRRSAREGIAQYTTTEVPEAGLAGIQHRPALHGRPVRRPGQLRAAARASERSSTPSTRRRATASSIWRRRPSCSRSSPRSSATPASTSGTTRRHSCGWSSRSHSAPISPPRASSIDRIQAVFDESHVYRIDHYLGKETVQNILAFRLAERHLRADLEPQLRRPRAAHGGRNGRRRAPRRLLRPDRRVPRHGREPHAAAADDRGHGAAGRLRGRAGARREAQGPQSACAASGRNRRAS